MYRGVAGVCFATILFVCGVAGFPTAPDQKPPATGQLTLTVAGAAPMTVVGGSHVDVRGSGFLALANVTIALYSSPDTLGEVTADASGNIAANVKIPDGARGDHTVVAMGNGPNTSDAVVLEAPVTIIAPSTTPAALVKTGINVAAWTGASLALLMAGLVLVRTAALRRRFLPAR